MTRGAVLLAVWWLVGGVGCGPGTSGEPGMPTATTSGPVEDLRGVAPVLPSTAATSASTHSIPAPPQAHQLVVPDWIATALKSADVQVRLQALDRWGQQGQTGSVDPLLLALTDPDERVRTRALQLIEQDWQAEQAVQGMKHR